MLVKFKMKLGDLAFDINYEEFGRVFKQLNEDNLFLRIEDCILRISDIDVVITTDQITRTCKLIDKCNSLNKCDGTENESLDEFKSMLNSLLSGKFK